MTANELREYFRVFGALSFIAIWGLISWMAIQLASTGDSDLVIHYLSAAGIALGIAYVGFRWAKLDRADPLYRVKMGALKLGSYFLVLVAVLLAFKLR